MLFIKGMHLSSVQSWTCVLLTLIFSACQLVSLTEFVSPLPGSCSQAISNLNLVYVLHFQIERFNVLLRIIKSSLIDLEKGIKGLVVMSSDLEETFNCIFDAKVPPLWGKVSDLIQRTSLLESPYNKRDKG